MMSTFKIISSKKSWTDCYRYKVKVVSTDISNCSQQYKRLKKNVGLIILWCRFDSLVESGLVLDVSIEGALHVKFATRGGLPSSTYMVWNFVELWLIFNISFDSLKICLMTPVLGELPDWNFLRISSWRILLLSNFVVPLACAEISPDPAK